MNKTQNKQTHIRSFVYRRPHITPGQQRALIKLMPLWGIPYRPAPIHLDNIFQRHAPTIIEIGSGMAEATIEIALQNPQNNYIAIEVYDAGVGALLHRIKEQQCRNLRVIQHDAVEVLRDMIPPFSLAGVHIFFPDPWPKKRHHKRRLIQPQFVDLVANRLQPNGYIHCATDWLNYAEHMLKVLNQCQWLKNSYPYFAPRPSKRPLTTFEQRGLKLGHQVWDLIFHRTTFKMAN